MSVSPEKSTPMSKGERDELRRIIRGDFKALAAELQQRQDELIADIEHRVALRFEPSEKAVRDCQRAITEIVATANEAIQVAVKEAQASADGYRPHWAPLPPPYIRWLPAKREEMRRALHADVAAKVGAARITLQRQEVELLKRLSIDALASDASRTFLDSIPKVADLVPAARLEQLEAAFSESGPGIPES